MTKPQDLMTDLKLMRRKWGMSAEDLAELLSVNVSTIAHNEGSIRQGMQLVDFCRWADALGCDVKIVFRG